MTQRNVEIESDNAAIKKMPDFSKLREPFPANQIGKLPRKGTGGLDYVGHAAVTDRLLAVDPEWTWEPMGYAPDGGPAIRNDGKTATMWIRLTVAGVTRPGVGSVMAGANEVEKQLVSDALRNAAMRFGVALDLWSKEDLLDAEANEAIPEETIGSVDVEWINTRLTNLGKYPDAWIAAGLPDRKNLTTMPVSRFAEATRLLDQASIEAASDEPFLFDGSQAEV